MVFRVPPDDRPVAICKSIAASASLANPGTDLKTVAQGDVLNSNGTPIPIHCLFDSGASACFISSKLVRQLHLNLQKSNIKAVATAAGKGTTLMGAIRIELRLDATLPGRLDAVNLPYLELTAHVLPDIVPGVQLIIGQAFMLSHAVSIEYDFPQCSMHDRRTRAFLILYPGAKAGVRVETRARDRWEVKIPDLSMRFQ